VERKKKGGGEEKGKVEERQLKKCWTHGRRDGRTDTKVILYSIQCYA